MSLPNLLSIEETSEVLRVSKESVKRLLRAGKIKRVKVGNRTLIKEADLELYIESVTE
jgi:excisionase family DNA binding protein